MIAKGVVRNYLILITVNLSTGDSLPIAITRQPVILSLALNEYLVVCLSLHMVVVCDSSTDDDIKTIEKISRETGYPIETHQIETEDRYVLTYHRVPWSKGQDIQAGGSRTPLLFVNGIMLCSYSMLTVDKGITFALVDAGYDVWLSNYRGNYYSRTHKDLDPVKDKEHFWNYTLTELGTYDLSAAIDYILARTGQPRLVYLGASMGTTIFWILGATRPQYMSKVSLMVALAPVARFSMNFRNTPVKYLLISTYIAIQRLMGIHAGMLYNEYYRKRMKEFCTNPEWLGLRCRIALSLIRLTMTGLSMEQFIKLLQIPSSSVSLNVLLHYLQIGKSQRFQMFDYGASRNMKLYGSSIPPEFSLKGVTCPVYMIYSKRDDVSSVEDIKWVQENLPNKPTRIIESVDNFNHMDFLLHKDANKLLNEPLAEFLRNKL